MEDNKLKQSFAFEKSMDYLSILPMLRKENADSLNINSKLDEIDSFLHKCIGASEYYDYLNANLNLDLRLFQNFSDKIILRELLNKSHSEGDIFLYVDSNIFLKGSQKDIRITIYRKLLSKLIYKYLEVYPNISHILISKNYREYIYNKVKLEILRDYKSLSITKIPPYRIWDKKNRKMMYFNAIPIDAKINNLKESMSKYSEKIQALSEMKKKILRDYYENWWKKYKQPIHKEYNEISNHFRYYDGVYIKIALAKTFLENPKEWVRTKSDIALCEEKKGNKTGEIAIEIDDKIHTILFLNDVFNEGLVDNLVIELHFDVNSLKKELNERVEGVVNLEIRDELLSLFKAYYDELIFKMFSEEILQLLGIYITDETGISYDIYFNEGKFKVFRFNKKDAINVEKVENLKDKDGKVIIISSAIIPEIIKRKYKNDDKINLIDINDLLSFVVKSRINTHRILKDLIYPFLKKKLKNEKVDMKIYQAQRILSKLKSCPEGIEGWKKFEDICIDIIDFVFRDSFRNFKIKVQSRNYNDLDIRDAIVQNTGKDFWRELRLDYSAKNIVFEFKNTSKEIGKDELIQLSDYLEKKSLGRVGIIFSRKGLSNRSIEKQMSLLRDANKLILVLNKNDIIDLVNKKLRNEEPDQILEALRFEIETSV